MVSWMNRPEMSSRNRLERIPDPERAEAGAVLVLALLCMAILLVLGIAILGAAALEFQAAKNLRSGHKARLLAESGIDSQWSVCPYARCVEQFHRVSSRHGELPHASASAGL